jgi:hypothetical protein
VNGNVNSFGSSLRATHNLAACSKSIEESISAGAGPNTNRPTLNQNRVIRQSAGPSLSIK